MLNITNSGRSPSLPKALLTAGLLGAAALSTLGAGAAHAVSPPPLPAWGSFSNGVLGQSFTYLGGDLTVTDLAANSGFENYIYLASPGYPPTKLSFLFTDNSIATAIFTPAQLSALGIMQGDELAFAIIPNSGLTGAVPPPTLPVFPSTAPFTGDPNSYIMFSGNSARNGDGLFHAAIYTGTGANAGEFIMGFEDTYNGGDFDFNDAAFRATSGVATQTVPGPLPLLGVGAAFGFSRRLRKRIKLVPSDV